MRRVHEILGTKPFKRVRRSPSVPTTHSAVVASEPSSGSGYTPRVSDPNCSEPLNPDVPPPPPDWLMQTDSAAQAGGTACIVTCHNYGRFLRKCLASILAQSLRFEHVIVVDDASTDDTPRIVAEHEVRGVRYLRGEWRDFTTARRAGLAALPRTRFLLFVDADNWLSADFHERLRGPMQNPKVGVAYAAIRYVDESGAPLRAQPFAKAFDYHALRRGNFADACSLVRTEAYEQVGGWEPCGAKTDWLLWLKITRAGWTMQLVPEAVLHYREHAASMLGGLRLNRSAAIAGDVEVMRRGFIVSIITLFSGRAWQLDRYADALRNLAWPRTNLRIVAIDNAHDPGFSERLQATLLSTGIPFILVQESARALEGWASRDLADSVPGRSRNAYIINAHLARLYARARGQMPFATDLVWCLEDDIEPPPDALTNLTAALVIVPDAGVVSGCVRDRFGGRMLAFVGPFDAGPVEENIGHLTEPPALDELKQINASGFMCSLFRRELWEAIAFRPSPLWDQRHPYYDWAAAHEAQRLGWKWMLAGNVRCKHWQADGTFVPVSRTDVARVADAGGYEPARPCRCEKPCGRCSEHR